MSLEIRYKMSQGKRILKNATYLTLGDKVGYLIQFLFFMVFARKFGVIPTGEYSFGFTFGYSCIIFADLGISVYLVREVSRNRSDGRELFFDCLILRFLLVLAVSIIAGTILAVFFNNLSSKKLGVIISWGLYWIFFSLADVFIAELNGHEKMGQVALLGICLKIMSTTIGVILIYMGLEYDIVVLALPVSSFIYLCAVVAISFYYLGTFRPALKNYSYYKGLILKLLPFCMSYLMVEIMWNQDILILGSIKSDESVGIYSAAIKIVSFILGMSPFFYTAMLPVLSRLYLESKDKLIELSSRILRYLIMASLPVSVGLAMVSRRVIELLYSDLFGDAAMVLAISAWMISAGFILAIFSVLLTAINRQKEKMFFIGITFFITTSLNFILIPYFDYRGAAIAKVVSEVTSLVLFMYLVSKYLTSLSFLKLLLRPVIACTVMGIFIYFFGDMNLMFVIALSALTYVIVLAALGTFTQQEIRLIRKLFPARESV
jgi:O-antigen/teichoic acid export membrane protein